MKKININLPLNLADGTLLWIYACNNKVFHSSKRFDIVEFTKHDSNYLGDVEEIFQANSEDRSSIKELLTQSERIYGIYLEENSQTEEKKDKSEVSVLFFPTWDEMELFAADYFKTYDKQVSKRIKEVERREQARSKWLERGRHFLRNSSTSLK